MSLVLEPGHDVRALLNELGARVFQRGWLSSNNVLFKDDAEGATVVDTGYSSHAEQTIGLLTAALDGSPVKRIVNTHLHSDHCGGNKAIQERWGSDVWVPAASFDTADRWCDAELTFLLTDQHCPRFRVSQPIETGAIGLGERIWQAIPAPGHDADALMFFEPESRTLISGDALWEDRLAIVFPELQALGGFASTRATLDLIEDLSPLMVIPGHGAPFADVQSALTKSRSRLTAFEEAPNSHHRYAARALTMFFMLQHQAVEEQTLKDWLRRTPLLVEIAAQLEVGDSGFDDFAIDIIERLILGGVMRRELGTLFTA